MGGDSNDGYELGIMATATVAEPQVDGILNSGFGDHRQLVRLGKKPVLKRNFGFMSVLGFSCAVLTTWEGALVTFKQGLENGGSAGIIYGFLFVWVGNIALFSTLSELVSMAPTSGGQYHWAAMLAPRSCARFLSYMTGWMTVAGWVGGVTSTGLLLATMIQGLTRITSPDYEPQAYQGMLVLWAVIAFAVFINVLVSSILAKLEGIILVLHIVGFFTILVVLVVFGSPSDASSTFTTFQNNGQWPSQLLSCLVGIIGNVWAFAGVDASFHMCEEVQNASLVVPKSIVTSCVINGAIGLVMIIAIMLYIGPDVEAVLQTPTGFPYMQLFLNVTGSAGGTTAMVAIILIMAISGAVGWLASTSRMLWSFARDRGLPGWKVLSKVDQRTCVPLWAVGIAATNCCLLGLINLGSSVALNDVLSIAISGLYTSYLICAVLLLYRRCTHSVVMPDPNTDLPPPLANTNSKDLVWGPWHIPGVWGIIVNLYSVSYVVIILFFSFWPPATPVDESTMNYSVLVTGGVALFSIFYYLVQAKNTYEGPIIESQ